ncbi:sensor domain-containing diguanylate cyclase [Thauera linaloolentis]|uniref:Diguanylate cyclase n=1 Tax=Thauera linaloolentis (strain DSM 12138 / JCM 21573 / CCUG 41526 / CIP 105981 / IAM 15112 / NBRC 102519 / 47Lol) TaxID=1123367 RepID=N6Y1E2_THAL4|nr:sensor domain-containing diguanylate cyclase [Thauera linaloolentis]ENO87991.1 diguanylate cyclase [Thauera linaloolentis 47Lol = DSM 12138]MCM8567072.1 diguanylate cyclase [Thauera linaloolentis]
MPIQLLKPFSLRLVLIVPYVVLVIALAIALGILSYSAGSSAVGTVSRHLLLETVGRISQAVDRHIVGSGAVLETAFPSDVPAPPSIEADFHEIRNRFWVATTLHTDPNNYVYYGNEAGQGLGLMRHTAQDVELRMKLRADEHRAVYHFSGIDGPLQFQRRETALFDPRTRPWYTNGKHTEGHTWTSVYIDFGTRQLIATRARQVHNADASFEGVVATDVSLKALNDFVGRLEVSPNGVAFIIEPDGNLIASSASSNVVTLPDGSGGRLNAGASDHALLKDAYVTVQGRIAARDDQNLPRVFEFKTADGSLIHAAFDRIRDEAGLDWVMVVAMPASDFLGGVRENVTRTIVLATLAVLLAIAIGLSILNWVSNDLRRLSEVARRVGDGELDTPVGIERRDEIGALARSFETMQNRLRTDRLTGLANREAFLEQLRRRIDAAHADRRRPRLGILFIDLNGFKAINDTYGHDAGDRALQEIAARLSHKLRQDDLVARYAGDEFVILLADVEHRGTLESIREHVDAFLREPLESIPGMNARVNGGAVGAALYPDDATDAEGLLKHADRVMYVEKLGKQQAE